MKIRLTQTSDVSKDSTSATVRGLASSSVVGSKVESPAQHRRNSRDSPSSSGPGLQHHNPKTAVDHQKQQKKSIWKRLFSCSFAFFGKQSDFHSEVYKSGNRVFINGKPLVNKHITRVQNFEKTRKRIVSVNPAIGEDVKNKPLQKSIWKRLFGSCLLFKGQKSRSGSEGFRRNVLKSRHESLSKKKRRRRQIQLLKGKGFELKKIDGSLRFVKDWTQTSFRSDGLIAQNLRDDSHRLEVHKPIALMRFGLKRTQNVNLNWKDMGFKCEPKVKPFDFFVRIESTINGIETSENIIDSRTESKPQMTGHKELVHGEDPIESVAAEEIGSVPMQLADNLAVVGRNIEQVKVSEAEQQIQKSSTESQEYRQQTHQKPLPNNLKGDTLETTVLNICPKIAKNMLQIVVESEPTLADNGIVLTDYLGYGAFGVIFSAQCKGRKIAVKFNRLGESRIKQIIEWISQLDHKNVCKIYDLKDPNHKVFGMECGSIDLQKYMQYFANSGLLLDLSSIRDFSKDIIEGIDYLNCMGYSHNDLKPANILIFQSSADKLTAKVTDFDFLVSIFDLKGELRQMSAPFGTPIFMGPEVLEKQILDDCRKPDIWAIGVVVYILLTGHIPFPKFDYRVKSCVEKQIRLIRDSISCLLNSLPNCDPNDESISHFIRVIKRLMDPNYKTRELLASIIADQLFISEPLVKKLSKEKRTLDPKNRIKGLAVF